MKNKITLLFLIVGMLTLIFACQKDDSTSETFETEAAAPQGPYKISTIDQSKVRQNNKLIAKLQDLGNMKSQNTQSNSEERIIYNETYDFTIDTDNVTYIESTDGTYHSYTFEVFRSDATGSLENLLLSWQEDGTYRALLISYDLTEQEKVNLLIGISPNYEGKVTATAIDDFDSDSILNRTSPFCVTFSAHCCSKGNHPNGRLPDGSLCPATAMCYSEYCPIPDGGGGYNPDPNNNGGTGGTSTGNPNVTDPTHSEQPWVGVFECLPSLNEVDNVSIRNWLIGHKRKSGELLAYLKDSENNCIVENTGFGLSAAQALAAGGEVDYVNHITTNFSVKSQCVYDKLVRTALQNHNLIRDTFLYFGNNSFSGGNLIYQEQLNLINADGEILLGSFYRESNNYYVTINKSQLDNRAPIEIAQTILHESVHALLKLHYDTVEESFIELFRQYMIQSTGSNSITHNIIRNNYVLNIANTLSQYDNGIEDFTFYENLAWEGLQEFLSVEEINSVLQAKIIARNRGLNCN